MPSVSIGAGDKWRNGSGTYNCPTCHVEWARQGYPHDKHPIVRRSDTRCSGCDSDIVWRCYELAAHAWDMRREVCSDCSITKQDFFNQPYGNGLPCKGQKGLSNAKS